MRAGMVGLLLALACGKDGGVASVLLVASVEVAPPSGDVVVGQTLQLTAVPKTEGGIVLPARDVIWASTDNATATVSSDGVVLARSVGGPIRVRATVSGVTGETVITVVPVPVDHIVVTPPSNNIVVGQSAQLTATAYDANDAELKGRNFVWGSSTPPVAAVTTTGLVLGVTAGGPVTITASAEGKSANAAVTVARRPASRLGFLQQPGPAIAGVALTPAIRVAIQDDLLGTVTTAVDQVTISLAGNPGGATLSGTRTVAAINGIATFTTLKVDRAGTGYTLMASAAGLSSAVSTPFNVAAGAANQLALTTAPPATARSGVPLAPGPVVQIRDNSGNPVQLGGIVITASLASGTGALQGTTTATTGSSGAATFGNLAISGAVGSYAIAFSAPAMTPVTSGPIALSPGLPSQLTMVTPPSGTAQSGQAFSQQPTVRLLDGSGNQVLQSGVAIVATIGSGPPGGVLGGSTIATTSADGSAAFAGLSLSGPPGSYVLTFGSSGLLPISSPPIALSAGAAAALSVTTQPSTVAPNATVFPRQPVIQLRDAANNPVAQAGVLVTASIQTGGGQLGGTATIATNGSGTATFTDLSITGIAGSRTLVFAAGGFVSVVSNPISIVAGPAAQLALTTQPSSAAQSGSAFAQQPVLALQDVSGNSVAESGIPITASIGTGPAGGSTVGTALVTTDATGVARYADLGLSGPPGSYTLAFGGPGLTPAASASVTLAPGAGSALSITTQPSSTVPSGTVFPQQPSIQLRDGAGNPVAQAGVVVTASILTGGGTLGGTVTATTDASGLGAFSKLSIGGAVGARTLGFDAPGYAQAVSASIAVTAGPATTLTITTQPSASAQSGTALAQQPVLQLRDDWVNPVSQAGVPVAVALTGAGGTLGGTLTVNSDAAGHVAYAGLSITGAPGSYSLNFTSAGMTGIQSSPIALGSAPATRLSITTQPPATVQSGALFSPQPAVQLLDGSGTPVSQSGVAITAAIASGGGALGGTATATTNGSGLATFTNLSITGTAGPRTLSFGSGSLTGATSAVINVTPAPATKLGITTQPPATAASGSTLSPAPVVQLQNAAGGAVAQAGVPITLALASGSGTLGGTLTVNSDATGKATFTGVSITGLVGNYSLGFTAASLTSATSNPIALTRGPASRLIITTQPPATTQDGQVLAPQPVIQIADAAGNPVPTSGAFVVASINSGPGTIGGTTIATTNSAGTATFTNLKISKKGSSTLKFTSAGLTQVISIAIVVN